MAYSVGSASIQCNKKCLTVVYWKTTKAKLTVKQKQRFRMRQKQINLSKKKGQKYFYQIEK